MTVTQKNQISQIENGSPAQICADAPDLASMIFSSNSDLREWAKKYEILNRDCSDSENIVAICTEARTHARTHAHAEQ